MPLRPETESTVLINHEEQFFNAKKSIVLNLIFKVNKSNLLQVTCIIKIKK